MLFDRHHKLRENQTSLNFPSHPKYARDPKSAMLLLHPDSDKVKHDLRMDGIMSWYYVQELLHLEPKNEVYLASNTGKSNKPQLVLRIRGPAGKFKKF